MTPFDTYMSTGRAESAFKKALFEAFILADPTEQGVLKRAFPLLFMPVYPASRIY